MNSGKTGISLITAGAILFLVILLAVSNIMSDHDKKELRSEVTRLEKALFVTNKAATKSLQISRDQMSKLGAEYNKCRIQALASETALIDSIKFVSDSLEEYTAQIDLLYKGLLNRGLKGSE